MAKKKMRADCLYERETTIIYNELELDCIVYTCNKKLQRAIERMGVKPDTKDHVGRKYHFPKSWLQPPQKPKEKGVQHNGRSTKRRGRDILRKRGPNKAKGDKGRKAASKVRSSPPRVKRGVLREDTHRPARAPAVKRQKDSPVLQRNSARDRDRVTAGGKGGAAKNQKSHMRKDASRRHER